MYKYYINMIIMKNIAYLSFFLTIATQKKSESILAYNIKIYRVYKFVIVIIISIIIVPYDK